MRAVGRTGGQAVGRANSLLTQPCHPEPFDYAQGRLREAAGPSHVPRSLPSGPIAALGVTLLVLLLPAVAHAHDGQPLAPYHLWSAWSFEPAVLVGLALSGWLYVAGVRALWRSAGTGRGVRRWEAAAFAGGWFIVSLALLSPLVVG